jgi:hypothetical protein
VRGGSIPSGDENGGLALGCSADTRGTKMDEVKGVSCRLFRDAQDEREFWSSFGYEGLAIVFDTPIERLRLLPEETKRRLMGLSNALAGEEGSTYRA